MARKAAVSGVSGILKGGRPPKIEEAAPLILAALRKGCTIKHACGAAGIGEETLREWRARGSEGESPYAEFLPEFDQARAEGLAKLIVEVAENEAWQAKAWILERTAPEDFRKRESTEVTGADGGPLKLDLAALLEEE